MQTVFINTKCIECDACVDICPMDCITFTVNGEEPELRARLNAPATNLTQDLYVSATLKTGRIMAKDEDVCLHCGLCAERCPTGAWDMQKFLLEMTRGRRRSRAPKAAIEPSSSASTTSSSSSPTSTARARLRPTNCSRAPILRMGVPVSPRNIFPSNIQGLPTWYEVRVTEEGWLGRRGGVDLMVAMNPQTWNQDLAEIEPGGYLFYDSTQPLPASKLRDDINVIGMPLTESAIATYDDSRQRQLFKNIIYVGALAALLDMDAGAIAELIGEQYKGKEKLLEAQPERDADGARLRARPPQVPDRPAREEGRRRRQQDLHGRQQRHRARRGVRRRHRVRLVPDYAIVLGRRGVQRYCGACASTRRAARTSSPSCRPRTNSPRSASSSAPAGTARAPSPPPPVRASR